LVKQKAAEESILKRLFFHQPLEETLTCLDYLAQFDKINKIKERKKKG
jgi:hypothetical protein